MVKDPGIAKQISQTMQHMWAELDCCIDNVREQCSAEEFKTFIKATRNIGCGIVFDVMEPLYDAHPNLKPANWDDVSTDGGSCGRKSEP